MVPIFVFFICVVYFYLFFSGNLLLVTSPGGNQDKLWCLSGDVFPMQPTLTEAQSIINLDGVVWAIDEIRLGDPPPISNVPLPPLIVRQIYEPAKKIVVLNPQVNISF